LNGNQSPDKIKSPLSYQDSFKGFKQDQPNGKKGNLCDDIDRNDSIKGTLTGRDVTPGFTPRGYINGAGGLPEVNWDKGGRTAGTSQGPVTPSVYSPEYTVFDSLYDGRHDSNSVQVLLSFIWILYSLLSLIFFCTNDFLAGLYGSV
jgi:hypothetical protein